MSESGESTDQPPESSQPTAEDEPEVEDSPPEDGDDSGTEGGESPAEPASDDEPVVEESPPEDPDYSFSDGDATRDEGDSPMGEDDSEPVVEDEPPGDSDADEAVEAEPSSEEPAEPDEAPPNEAQEDERPSEDVDSDAADSTADRDDEAEHQERPDDNERPNLDSEPEGAEREPEHDVERNVDGELTDAETERDDAVDHERQDESQEPLELTEGETEPHPEATSRDEDPPEDQESDRAELGRASESQPVDDPTDVDNELQRSIDNESTAGASAEEPKESAETSEQTSELPESKPTDAAPGAAADRPPAGSPDRLATSDSADPGGASVDSSDAEARQRSGPGIESAERSDAGLAPEKAGELLEGGREVPGGLAFYGDGDPTALAADKLGEFEGTRKYDLHGASDHVVIDGQELTAKEFADVVRADPGWNGQPITLFSCDTGKSVDGGDSFAQDLANELGVPVTAPTELAWSNGGPFASSGRYDTDGNFVPTEPPDGEFQTFVPGGTAGTTTDLAPGEPPTPSASPNDEARSARPSDVQRAELEPEAERQRVERSQQIAQIETVQNASLDSMSQQVAHNWEQLKATEVQGDGHAILRHEGQVTAEDHIARLETGVTPDGQPGPIVPHSTNFTSPAALADTDLAVRNTHEFAQKQAQAELYDKDGSRYFTVNVQVPGVAEHSSGVSSDGAGGTRPSEFDSETIVFAAYIQNGPGEPWQTVTIYPRGR